MRAPRRLRLEYRENPLGLDELKPRFSWELDDARRGASQTAYSIRVAEDEEKLASGQGLVWESGKVASDATNQVEYAGPPLRYDHAYWWSVQAFDADGKESPWAAPATWRMGPITVSDWSTSQWIADAAPVEKSQRAHDGWRSHWQKNADDMVWVQIDFGRQRPFDRVVLHPAHPFDVKDAGAGYLFPIQYRVWVADEPTFLAKPPLHVVDETFFDVKNPGDEPKQHDLGSRMSARYVRIGFLKLPEVKGQGFGVALSELELRDQGEVVSRGATITCSDSLEEGGWSILNLFDGDTGSHPARDVPPPPAPMLRREFTLASGVKRATAYASALGVYELRFNGAKAGDRELAPEWTKYDGHAQYQAYDVTSLLKQGANAVGAWLGDGWYAGRIGLADQLPGYPKRGLYGDKPVFLMQLEVDLANGEHVTVRTDSEWTSTSEGPIRSSDLLDGETYDARLFPAGWDQAGFDAKAWKQVEHVGDPAEGLFAQTIEPMRVVAELPAVAITEPEPHVFVADFGRNVTGRVRLSCTGAAGTSLTLRHGEMLNEDGTLYTANLRGAAQTDRYVMRGGGAETFEPRFTLHGFRYVAITGLASKPTAKDVLARVIRTDARETGTFTCSEPVLDALWRNAVASLEGNLTGIATDCPQRDERLGWTGDFNVFAQTGMYAMDLGAFMGKWARDVREAQAENGRFPDIAPHPFDPNERFSSSPGWADAGVSVPWQAYVNYGDRRLLQRHYAAMRKYVDFMMNNNRQYRWEYHRGRDYGDWLNGSTISAPGWDVNGCDVGKELFATAFLHDTMSTFSRIARMLTGSEDPSSVYQGEPMGYGGYSDNVARAFAATWIDGEGRIVGDTQAGYAIALSTDCVPKHLRAPFAERLKRAIDSRDGQLTTGFHTTKRALIELSRAGIPADGYLCEKRFPALGWQVEQGATTMWERRDGYVPGRGFADPGMNSFDHFAFGSVGEWLMGWLVGIRPDDKEPGWKHFTVAPAPTSKVTSARGTHDTIRGRVEVAWKKDAKGFELEVLVPAGASATVVLPAAENAQLFEGEKPIDDASPFVKLASRDKKNATLEVRAGRYRFRAGA